MRVGCPMDLRVANSSRLAAVATSLPTAHSPMQVGTWCSAQDMPFNCLRMPCTAYHACLQAWLVPSAELQRRPLTG